MSHVNTVITWNTEWSEYVVRRGRATFHTDDYADAVGTAAVMANGGPIIDRTPKSRRVVK